MSRIIKKFDRFVQENATVTIKEGLMSEIDIIGQHAESRDEFVHDVQELLRKSAHDKTSADDVDAIERMADAYFDADGEKKSSMVEESTSTDKVARIQPFEYYKMGKTQIVYVDLDHPSPDPSKKLIWGWDEDGDTVPGDFKRAFTKVGKPISISYAVSSRMTANQAKAAKSDAIVDWIKSRKTSGKVEESKNWDTASLHAALKQLSRGLKRNAGPDEVFDVADTWLSDNPEAEEFIRKQEKTPHPRSWVAYFISK